MGQISVLNSITLDGVMQSPGRPDEDTRGGFTHGGWAEGYADHVAGQFLAEGMGSVEAMLFGRRTYEDLLQHWTTTPEPNPFADVLVNTPKYVVTGSGDLAFPNSTPRDLRRRREPPRGHEPLLHGQRRAAPRPRR